MNLNFHFRFILMPAILVLGLSTISYSQKVVNDSTLFLKNNKLIYDELNRLENRISETIINRLDI